MSLTPDQEKTALRLRFAAHSYVDIGWNVFPLQPRSKEPHHKALKHTNTVFDYNDGQGPKASWKALQTVRVTHDLVNQWYDFDPFCNIGLICGELSGIVVVDIDVPKASLPPEVACLYDDPVDVANTLGIFTLSTHTGSKGKHLFTRYDPKHPVNCAKVPPQIDVKGHGGYVVLPPSIHPNGNPYIFENLDFFPLQKGLNASLAPFPEMLLPRVATTEKKTPDQWLSELNGVQEGIGARNETAASLMGKLLSAIHHEFDKNDWEDGRFIPLLWDFLCWWNQKNTPPLPEKELSTVFKSITKRG